MFMSHIFQRYYNCSCIEKKAEITSTESVNFEAKAGKCETHCTNLPVFLGMFFVTVIYTFMAGTRITVSILSYVCVVKFLFPKTTC